MARPAGSTSLSREKHDPGPRARGLIFKFSSPTWHGPPIMGPAHQLLKPAGGPVNRPDPVHAHLYLINLYTTKTICNYNRKNACHDPHQAPGIGFFL